MERRTGFSDGCRVVVEQADDREWIVREGFTYTGGQGDVFEVYEGMRTDFASVPRIFVWLLPRYGRWTKAALLHDLLWRDYASAGRMDWIDADGLFRRAMRELGVPFLRRWVMWTAVRWAALVKPGGRRRWFAEAHRVLLFSLIALPVVAPPAAVILVCLLLFWLWEALVWLALAAGRLVRTPEKDLNPPELEWKTA